MYLERRYIYLFYYTHLKFEGGFILLEGLMGLLQNLGRELGVDMSLAASAFPLPRLKITS